MLSEKKTLSFAARTPGDTLVPLTLFLVFLFSSHYFNQTSLKPPLFVEKQKTSINFHPYFFQVLNLGNKRMISKLMWIQTLLESDLEHYKKADLNSWMFLRFDTITTLEPRFIEAYVYGGKYLSVIKDDKWGAKFLFDKGLRLFPEDYNLNFYGGAHYFLELDNAETASRLWFKIQDHPRAGAFIKSLVARFKAESGDLDTAYQLIRQAYEKEPEGSELKKRYHNSLYSLQAELDLNCLNRTPEAKCPKRDLLGKPYVRDVVTGKFRTLYPFRPFRPYKVGGKGEK